MHLFSKNMKFMHLADCHLGALRQPELNLLNFQSFQKALQNAIKEKVEFLLIAGDLFDSAYPSIDTLKETFREFRRLKEADIPVFIIAGSHDYSVSGKTFLDVLEKSGFCKNVSVFEEKNGKIILQPTLYKNVAIFGYPGKKSGLEVDEIEKIKLEDCPGFFKILMLHTTIKSAVLNPRIKSVDDSKLPSVNYLALGHLHINFNKNGRVYSGPIFPNNLPELEELKWGSYCLYNNGKIERREIKLKNILLVPYDLNNALRATDEIIELLKKEILKDKVVLLKISGIIEIGKIADMDFGKIELYVKGQGAYVFIKNTSKISLSETELEIDTIDTEDMESQIIEKFMGSNESRFNHLVLPLMRALQTEKIYDEKSSVFEERILSETKKITGI